MAGENAFADIQELTRGEVEKEEVLNAEDEKEKLPVKVSYESDDKEYAFSYQSLDTGIKESITLYEAPDDHKLQFRFYAKGMTAKKMFWTEELPFRQRDRGYCGVSGSAKHE